MHETTTIAEFKRLFGPIKVAHTLLADADIFESFCESERDRVHLENAKPQR